MLFNHPVKILSRALLALMLLGVSFSLYAATPQYLQFAISDNPVLRDNPELGEGYRHWVPVGELILFSQQDPNVNPDPSEACDRIYQDMLGVVPWFVFAEDGSVIGTTTFVNWQQNGQPIPFSFGLGLVYTNDIPDQDYEFGSCNFRQDVLFYSDGTISTIYNFPLYVRAPCGPVNPYLQADLSCGTEPPPPEDIADSDKGQKCRTNTEGNPVDPASGNKFQREEDYANPAIGLEVTRYYNSGEAKKDVGFGFGWRGLGVSQIEPDPNAIDRVVSRAPDGKGTDFSCTGSDCAAAPSVPLLLSASTSEWRLDNPDGGFSVYNKSSGKLTRKVNAQGQSTNYYYNTSGQLDRISNWSGHEILIYYDSSARINRVVTPDGQQILYGYSSSGNLVVVKYPDNSGRRYFYEDSRSPSHLTGISIITTDGTETRYATWRYDSAGRAISSEHAQTSNGVPQEQVTLSYVGAKTTSATDSEGRERFYSYREINGINSILNRTWSADGKGFSNSYNADGKLTSRVNADGSQTAFLYNTAGQRIQIVDNVDGATTGTPVRTTDIQYLNTRSDKVLKISRDGVVPTIRSTTEIHYPGVNDIGGWCAGEPAGQPCAITTSGYKPDGSLVTQIVKMRRNINGQLLLLDGPRTDVNDVTRLTYYNCTTGGACGQLQSVTNALGQQITFDAYSQDGKLTQVTDSNGLVTTTTYDVRGRVDSLTQTPVSGLARVSRFTYNAFGAIQTATQANNVVLTYGYDAAQDLRSITDNLGNLIEYDYDARGNRSANRVIDINGTLVRDIQQSYDLRDNIDSINDAGNITQLVNDAVGNLTQRTDPNNNTPTQNTYDALNRLTQTVDSLGGITNYSYDVADRLIQAKAPNNATTDYIYDDFGNLLSETGPDRGVLSYTYDDAGNMATSTDARAITATYSYDALNRLTGIVYPDNNENVSLAYDTCTLGKGRLCQMVDQSGTTSYQYDAYGNVTEQSYTELGVTYVTAYQYDAGNNIIQTTYPDGRVVNVSRDALGRVAGLNTNVNGINTAVVSNLTYGADYQLTGRTFGNGLVETRQYDLKGQLISQDMPVVIAGTGVVTSTLAASSPSPQAVNQVINFTATAAGGNGSYSYRFLLQGPATSNIATEVQAFSLNSTWSWQTTAADTGTNIVIVEVKIAGSTSAFDTSAQLNVDIIVPVAATSVTVTTSPASPQNVGTAITVTAQGQGGTGPYEYQFWRSGPGFAWAIVQDYSASNTFTFMPTEADAGNQYFRVRNRTVGAAVTHEEIKTTPAFKVVSSNTPPTTAILAFSPASPQIAGTPITLTVQGQGGTGAYEYQFWRAGPGFALAVVQDYSTSNTFTFTPAAADVGSQYFQVRTRTLGATVIHEEINYAPMYVITSTTVQLDQGFDNGTAWQVLPAAITSSEQVTHPVTGVASPASNQGTSALIITPDENTPDSYQFWVKSPLTNNQWLATPDYKQYLTGLPDLIVHSGLTAVQTWTKQPGTSGRYEYSRSITAATMTPVATSTSTVTPGTEILTYQYDANGNLLNRQGATMYSYGYDSLDRLIQDVLPGLPALNLVYDANGNRTNLTFDAFVAKPIPIYPIAINYKLSAATVLLVMPRAIAPVIKTVTAPLLITMPADYSQSTKAVTWLRPIPTMPSANAPARSPLIITKPPCITMT